jgi:isopenicillin N synthase-like dioxygenase
MSFFFAELFIPPVFQTDLGSVTLLFRQPVAALQVLTSTDQTWHWVKPYKESITVNIADTLQILSGGYLKSSVHRVHVPPKDQAQYDRIGVLTFGELGPASKYPPSSLLTFHLVHGPSSPQQRSQG